MYEAKQLISRLLKMSVEKDRLATKIKERNFTEVDEAQ
jgi:hypothetical protein